MREAVMQMHVAALMPPLGAGEEIGTALNRMIAWTQSILIPMAILTFIVGIVFLMIGGTAGHQQRGKTLMVAAVIGVILGFLAGPIVNLAATFVR
jgi:Type IV secretion system pilin